MNKKKTIIGILAIMALPFIFNSCKGEDTIANESNEVCLDSLKSLFSGEVDVFEADAEGQTKVCIFSIKHATMAILIDGKWIYVDANASVIEDASIYAAMPKADYMLFTHDHYDHFDMPTLEQLSKETTRYIANPTTIAAIGCGDSLRNGESITIEKGWKIEAVPAYNNSEEKLEFHPQGRDNGYILNIGDLRIYIAGDTEVIPELAEIKDIDVAFLPCNLPFTMTPEQCNEAARIIMPKVLFPYHYSDTEISRVPELLADTDIDVRIRQYQ